MFIEGRIYESHPKRFIVKNIRIFKNWGEKKSIFITSNTFMAHFSKYIDNLDLVNINKFVKVIFGHVFIMIIISFEI